MTNTRNEIKAQIIRAGFWGKGRRTATACERPFSALFALFSSLGASPAASKRTKITRELPAHRCFAVFTEQILRESRRSPQEIHPYFQGLERRIMQNLPVKTGSSPASFAHMQELLDRLHDDYGWSDSVSNFSNKLARNSLRYREAIELADVLGYDLVWQKRRER